VPNLKGKTRAKAVAALRHAHCRLGTVKSRRAVLNKRGRVLKQTATPGARQPKGYAVGVTLGRR
jgi:beta-lactam-binding protein with PASTA domain